MMEVPPSVAATQSVCVATSTRGGQRPTPPADPFPPPWEYEVERTYVGPLPFGGWLLCGWGGFASQVGDPVVLRATCPLGKRAMRLGAAFLGYLSPGLAHSSWRFPVSRLLLSCRGVPGVASPVG